MLRQAAGTQITQLKNSEVVNANKGDGRFMSFISFNGNFVNKIKKASGGIVLVPAAAVIPAPRSYVNIDAVKKLVVGSVRNEGNKNIEIK